MKGNKSAGITMGKDLLVGTLRYLPSVGFIDSGGADILGMYAVLGLGIG